MRRLKSSVSQSHSFSMPRFSGRRTATYCDLSARVSTSSSHPALIDVPSSNTAVWLSTMSIAAGGVSPSGTVLFSSSSDEQPTASTAAAISNHNFIFI